MAVFKVRYFSYISAVFNFFLFSDISQVNAQAPIQAQWSSRGYGADGPWPAVEVTVGSDSKLALFPGRPFQTFVISTDYCRLNISEGCYASMAGTYNRAQSEMERTGSDMGIRFSPPHKESMLGMSVRGGDFVSWVDSADIGHARVADSSLVLIESQMMAYPGGQWYPMSAGCLGVGGPSAINQSFTTSTYPINATLIPGRLWERGDVPSNSFGLHIGSMQPPLGGSLWFGGYDQNRVIGDVLVTATSFHEAPITLRDISLEVVQGASPFTFDTKQDNLLTANNDTMGSALPVYVDGCSPYLTLPKSTCDNIASHLPVIYDSDLGLYLWNTSDPYWPLVVSSASVLAFTFLASSNTETLVVRVPFSHLNLTLTAPLVNGDPKPYFPCFTGGDGLYTLGRAFLQDAFLGANWNQDKWFVAQAPGPKVQASPDVVAIQESDEVIESGSNDWAASWDGFWKVLTPDEVDVGPASTGLNTETASPPGDDTAGDGGGLSTGAMAGIGAAAGAVVLAFLAAGFLLWRKRKARAGSSKRRQPVDANLNGCHEDGVVKGPGGYRYGNPAELRDTSPPSVVRELDGNAQWLQHEGDDNNGPRTHELA
ncbi:conserved hypothetical protein [Verticillium alfalfae VaMs.102]|uniref:Peptidase A1 domain-containing protein n=1 Tax=Verticillium alfalfae (strain VaMs.102 / ATCC MYA-4576 / FGSC 10136) TaxID=526221 RepID=C9SF88_VERA1|nr:conserved hypothetical protein [Verticillium alfalfae VaMs.102]EEY17874.1 conserved hypothetical protein [Verticillium alfalfae VaMs.102]